jgi:hypothetical protein
VIFLNCDPCATRNRRLLNVEVLRDETVCCPAFEVSALSALLVAGGTRAGRLLEPYLAGRYVVCRAPSA